MHSDFSFDSLNNAIWHIEERRLPTATYDEVAAH